MTDLKAQWERLKTSTKGFVVFFLFNISLTQIESARDWIVPKLVHHPKWAGVVLSLFGIAIVLHRPQVQKFLKHEPDGQALTPAEPGAQVDDVKVVTKDQV